MIGILFGLYCNISIALIVLVLFHLIMYYLKKNQKIQKYNKIWKIENVAILFSISILISTTFTLIQDKDFENKNEELKKSNQYSGVIISNPIQKEYGMQYSLKINKIGNKTVDIKTVYLMVSGKNILEYGDEISLKGEYKEPDRARNDKGFDYKQYLKSNRSCWNNNDI